MQTLTILDLGGSELGPVATKHLADALRVNKVRKIGISFLLFYCFLFLIDTRYSQP